MDRDERLVVPNCELLNKLEAGPVSALLPRFTTNVVRDAGKDGGKRSGRMEPDN